GSTATGRWINQAMAHREGGHPAALIAETGGQNAMIVDSSALAEQVVTDVINSAFLSAGQRCSGLRVLYLQEDIADRIIDMLRGAMAQLKIGDPADVSNDIGPVIDARALQRLETHCDYLDGPDVVAELLYRCELSDGCGQGYFFAPRLYQIGSIELLPQEVFGPVVHIIRYPGTGFNQVIEQVNRTGYGLTLGLHSRLESRWQQTIDQARVGNIYINRDMVGAVVGVQPFGGQGLSGTGPKAGGPLYLSRLMRWPTFANTRLSKQPVDDPGGTDLPDVNGQQGLLKAMAAVQVRWGNQPLSTRAALINRMADWLKDHDLAVEMSMGHKQTLISAIAELLEQGNQLLADDWAMPGPTGQRDVYFLHSRGLVLLLADSARPIDLVGCLFQLLSALLCGNTVMIISAENQLSVDAGFWKKCLSLLHQQGLPDSLVSLLSMAHLSSLLAHEDLSAVVLVAGSDRLKSVEQRLANRPGALVPLITELAARPLIARLSQEKSISINSSAAGGNAELLCLGD
ncbi:MAG: aldehyde dehydrogenase family protein, partial [Immundisolibacteraceae bacterium]|nr:aldehyde dehydrogenase family protein [Immundisolibacteraceae bacterium]